MLFCVCFQRMASYFFQFGRNLGRNGLRLIRRHLSSVEFLSFPPPKQLRNKVMGRGRWLSQRNLSAPPTSRESTKLDGNQEKKEEGKQNKHLTLSANNDIDIDVFIPNENHKRSQEDIRGGKLAHPRTDSSLVRGGPSSLPRHGKRRLRAHSK